MDFSKKNISLLLIGLSGMASAEKDIPVVPADAFEVPEGLEVKVWAKSPLFYNPTNMDIDHQGRIWVAEGRNYRSFRNGFAKPYDGKGDRIMVVSDTDGDGVADSSHVFVQDPQLVAPLGVAVIGNKVVVSQPPSLLVYHDVNGDAVFDEKVDKKEALLTGFGGQNHDHSLHAVTVAPSGQWYFNTGNAGTHLIKDNDGFTLRFGSVYTGGSPSVSRKGPHQGGKPGLVSDDGHVYVGAAVLRMNADGTGLRVVGHNMRNSYEETINSFGDVFQNDNDDPPASRTTWLMEYGNLGFASDDGARKWLVDRRPGQNIPTAEWRQEDPGKIPAGDVYGNGSPTGIVYYENGALGEDWTGLLLSCEAARNKVFGYFPKPTGAGYSMDRFDFMKIKEDLNVSSNGVSPFNFRPSDVAVGPDGAIYVADWFDAGVGGHKMTDKSFAGAIYRIAPKAAKLSIPKFDLNTTAGQVAALKSSAKNVRSLGFTRLKEAGAKSIPALNELLNDESDYIKARAIWLLAQLGEEGIAKVEKLLEESSNDYLRQASFRALRFVDYKVLELAKAYAQDKSVGLRREIALALRDYSWEEAGGIIYDLAVQYDGKDRWYLEAIGTAATKKDSQLYDLLVAKFAKGQKPTEWSTAMARLAWRLHPEQSVEALKARASSPAISKTARTEMLTALGYIPTEASALAMVDIAENGPADNKGMAQWWLASLSKSSWSNYKNQMKGLNVNPNILPNDRDYLVSTSGPNITNPSVDEVLNASGDAEKGKITIARCYMCHLVDGKGVEFGPELTEWGAGRSIEAIATAIIHPNDGIAHGFDGTTIYTKKGHKIQGINQGGGNQQFIRVMGGGEVEVPKSIFKKKEEMHTTLMLSAGQLGLKSQDVADIAAYLKALGKEKTK